MPGDPDAFRVTQEARWKAASSLHL